MPGTQVLLKDAESTKTGTTGGTTRQRETTFLQVGEKPGREILQLYLSLAGYEIVSC